MTAGVQALYHALVLDHGQRPRNLRRIEAARQAEGGKPLCGDRVTVSVRLAEGAITEVAFDGWGCAIATASAPLMTDSVKGKTLDELGAQSALAGVRRFPMRVRCATLPWRTLRVAVEGHRCVVSTDIGRRITVPCIVERRSGCSRLFGAPKSDPNLWPSPRSCA